MLPAIALLVKGLADAGLSILGDAVLAKGKEVVEKTIGVKLPDDPSGLTPELKQTLQIKQMEHEEALIKLAIQKAELDLKDKVLDNQNTANARAMQVAALQQQDPVAKRFVYFFAWAWSTFTAAYIASITFGKIPDDNQHYADTILGFLLGTLISTIINFFFGGVHRSTNAERAGDRK